MIKYHVSPQYCQNSKDNTSYVLIIITNDFNCWFYQKLFFKHNFDSIIKYEVNLFPKFDFIISFLCVLKNVYFGNTWYLVLATTI